jgi:hypothetical protein
MSSILFLFDKYVFYSLSERKGTLENLQSIVASIEAAISYNSRACTRDVKHAIAVCATGISKRALLFGSKDS